MADSALNDKRAKALHGTRRASHKISRLKNKVDVIVAGSEYDPRRPPKVVKGYNERQLDAYNARVAQFLDRSTQFVPDAKKRPIPAQEFKDYKTAELNRRKHVLEQYNKVKDILLPGADGKPGHETIGQRRDKMRSDRKMAGNPSVNDPYDPPVRGSKWFADRKAVKELARDERKKSTAGWDRKELKRQIGEFSQMIGRIGDADMAAKVGKLTPAQFRTLWNDTGFATAVSSEYEIFRATLVEQEDKAWYSTVISDAFQDANRLVDWAGQLNMTEENEKVSQKMINQRDRNYMTERGIRPKGMPTT